MEAASEISTPDSTMPPARRRRAALVLVCVIAAGLASTTLATVVFHGAAMESETRRRVETLSAIAGLLRTDLLRISSLVGGFQAWVGETGFDDPLAFEAYYATATRYLDTVPWRAAFVAQLLPRAELATRVAELESRRARYDASGYPALNVFPDSEAAVAAPVFLVESDGGRARVFGFDLASEDIRRRKLLAALETGRPVLTAPVTPSPDADLDPSEAPRGLILFAPVRRTGAGGRSEAGVVGFGIMHEALVGNAVGRVTGQDMDGRIVISAVADAETATSVEVSRESMLRVRFLDQLWEIDFERATAGASTRSFGAGLVFLFGLVATDPDAAHARRAAASGGRAGRKDPGTRTHARRDRRRLSRRRARSPDRRRRP